MMSEVAGSALVLGAMALAAVPLLLASLSSRFFTLGLALAGLIAAAALASHLGWVFKQSAGSAKAAAPSLPTADETLTAQLQSIGIECDRVIKVSDPGTASSEVVVDCLRKEGSEEEIQYLLNRDKGTVRLRKK